MINVIENTLYHELGHAIVEIYQLPIILKKPKELDQIDALSKNILVCKKFGLSLTETKHILKDYKEIEIRRKYKEISD